MATYLWRKIKGGSPSARVLSAYVALVLALAVAGPGLAVFAGEGEVTEPPLAEEPLVEAPVIEEPLAEEPLAEEPVIEEPLAEEPLAEEPIVPALGVMALAKVSPSATATDGDPSTSGVVPTMVDGNPSLCPGGLRVPPASGTYTKMVGDTLATIQVTITDKPGYGEVFSFTSDYPIARVVAKGGNGANIYYYDPATYGDGELHSPVNPSGFYADLSHIDFCFGVPQEPETGDVLVYKFEDLNENGEYDEGEPMLEGWEFTLVRQSPPIAEISASAIELIGIDETDGDGEILWTELMPGDDYNVTETLKDGWKNTTPLSRDIEVIAGQTTEVWFGNARDIVEPEYGALNIYKFEDLNENGEYDAGEPMLEDWEFSTVGPEFSETDMTGADGAIHYIDLLPGEFTATETLKDGWINTTPLSQVADVVAGETAELWFGNIRMPAEPEYGDLIIYKFEDLNENGEYDAGEPMLEDWEFVITGDGMADDGLTDADGELLFSDLLPGEYTVVENLTDGWTNTTPLVRTVTVVAGDTVEVWFGNIEEPFAPFTPDDPYLPFTGGELGLILGAAAAAATAGTAMRLKGHRRS
jgi:hypothetical protein